MCTMRVACLSAENCKVTGLPHAPDQREKHDVLPPETNTLLDALISALTVTSLDLGDSRGFGLKDACHWSSGTHSHSPILRPS